MEYPRFGTAGAGDLFYSKGHKKTEEVPAFLKERNLNAFEYQCGRGVRIGTDKAAALGEEAKKNGIALSIHAPYYISLAIDDSEKMQKNLQYFMDSAHAARAMGATRIVFHPGGTAKMNREEACGLAKRALTFIMKELNDSGYDDILFCPETMGKMNQLGNLEEVLRLSRIAENMIPCVDFGHMNSRHQGEVNSYQAFEQIFWQVADALGTDKAKQLHCHFSKIEYSTGGEKKHLTFADTVYGPSYEPLMELLYKKAYTPTIICESAGTQAEDAGSMQQYYQSLVE